jgi:hypothetical protein
MASDHIWQRGRQYYFRMPIPRPMRHLFLASTSKPTVRIVERLSDSHSQARILAAERTAQCLDVFARIKAGLLTTPEQVKAALQPSEPDIANAPGFDRAMREWYATRRVERQAQRFEILGDNLTRIATGEQPARHNVGETVSEAAEAWLRELARDEAPRDTTLQGHRDRVRAFVAKVGDLPLAEVTRAMASDFLAGLNVSARTRNSYALSLRNLFRSAGRRGRFSNAEEDNPFSDQRAKVTKNSYVPFTVAELQAVLDALPRDVKPRKHTPATALSWCAARGGCAVKHRRHSHGGCERRDRHRHRHSQRRLEQVEE